MEIYNETYCVYIHTNKINGKMYCGQTIRGDNPNRRWQNGSGYLNKNNDGSYKQPLMARAIQKYGWDNFEHEIIASNLTEQEAKNFEILIIDKLQLRNTKYGYNLTDGGEGTKGWTISEETREKFRERQKGKIGALSPMYGKHHSKESREKMSRVRFLRGSSKEQNDYIDSMEILLCQYDKNGLLVNNYLGVKYASDETGISRSAISNCLCGLSHTAGGYIWKYSHEELTDEEILLVNSGKSRKIKKYLQAECWLDKKLGKYKVRFKKDGEYICSKTYLTKEDADLAINNYKNNKESW